MSNHCDPSFQIGVPADFSCNGSNMSFAANIKWYKVALVSSSPAIDGPHQNFKSGQQPLGLPNIPLFTAIPSLAEPAAAIAIMPRPLESKHCPSGVKSTPGPLDPASAFYC
jgi:hypothetical protein